MPTYTYRRDDGTTFEIQQRFADEPLTVDPTTGQKVVRIVSAANIIFKGSGFYATDNKKSSGASAPARSGDKTETKSETAAESKTETKTEAKSETKSPASPPVSSAAD